LGLRSRLHHANLAYREECGGRAYLLLQPHISFSDRFIDPVHEGIDIVVRIGGPDAWPPGLGHRFIGAQRLVFCAAPGYLGEHGTPGSVAELENHHCIEVLPELATDGLPMNLVWLKSRESLPKVSVLLEYLSERLAPHGSV
jgi:DNA-binding transcriptional LysR family regulator